MPEQDITIGTKLHRFVVKMAWLNGTPTVERWRTTGHATNVLADSFVMVTAGGGQWLQRDVLGKAVLLERTDAVVMAAVVTTDEHEAGFKIAGELAWSACMQHARRWSAAARAVETNAMIGAR